MRAIPGGISAALAAGVSTLAHVWRITRRDGAAFAFTDHDRALSFDELTCAPSDGLRVGAIEKSVGLNVDSAAMSGVLSAAAITEEDLVRGIWDSARVDVYRVDWRDPTQRVHLFAGRIGSVRRGRLAFEAELRGLQAPLNVAMGRVYSRYCDADVGDARCGKPLAASAFSATATVDNVLGDRTFRCAALGGFSAHWFDFGRIVWTGGGESEVAAHTRDGDDGVIELTQTPGIALAAGAEFTIYAGCNKRAETCRVKFDNVANFRGFPHMPGNDAMQAAPAEGTVHDGGSRWR